MSKIERKKIKTSRFTSLNTKMPQRRVPICDVTLFFARKTAAKDAFITFITREHVVNLRGEAPSPLGPISLIFMQFFWGGGRIWPNNSLDLKLPLENPGSATITYLSQNNKYEEIKRIKLDMRTANTL